MKYLAAAALLGAVATIPIVGGVLFGAFALGLFLLALVGVVGGLEDRTVRPHGGVRDPRGWRDGS
jgi:hypothetical protein